MSDNYYYIQKKTEQSIRYICHFLLYAPDIPAPEFEKPLPDLKLHLHSALSDLLKVYTSAIKSKRGDNSLTLWSPDLVDYLYDNPGKWDETMEIILSDDYRDGYFDDFKEF